MSVHIAAVRAGPELPAHLARQVWRGNELGHAARGSVSSGHALLDAQLPDGGWPRAALTELLSARPGCGEMRLLAPALAELTAHPLAPRHAVLISPPYVPYAPALAAAGIALDKLVWVDAHNADALWAAEQALRHDGVGAVMLWLPRAQPAALRRLQVLAQDGSALAFLMRPATAAAQSSPAPLRLKYEPADVRGAWLQSVSEVANRASEWGQRRGQQQRQQRGQQPGQTQGQQQGQAQSPLRAHESMHVRTAAADGLERAGLRIDIVKRRGPAMAVPLWVTLPVRVAPFVADIPESPDVAEIDHGVDRGAPAAAATRSGTTSVV
ncbi:protein ImuA [Pararobbsia alpina]|uniref:translesion DNA synthesis-associated protein ImuA n=1 Tax=Pararobbsia alpina TaxID=621374 RepID=UPI0039A40855